MNLATDLLALAHRLSNLERTRPRQATLRRSVSTSYYALFHLLTTEAVGRIGPNLKPAAAHKLQRWFDHREMKRTAGVFSAAVVSSPIHSVLGVAPSVDLQHLAQAFVRLQGARHQADYNLEGSWSRVEAQEYVELAHSAFSAWAHIRRSHEANVFALALLSSKLFEKER